MKAIHTALAALLIALAVVAGAQNGRAQWQTPLDFPNWSKSRVACKAFGTELEARSAGAWNSLDIVRDQPDRAKLAQAELERLGGARLVLEVDAKALRKEMLEQSRGDVRRVVREARMGSPAAVTIRDDTIEFHSRNRADGAAALNAFGPLLSGPVPPLVGRGLDDERAARGVVAFAVSDQAFEERRKASEHAMIDIMDRRVREVGIETPLIQALGGGRILIIAPGLKEPERLWQLLHRSTARLTFQIADRSANPCAAPTAPNGDLELLTHRATSSSLLVRRTAVASGQDLAAVEIVLDSRTGAPAVALRFNANATSRLAKASADITGQAIVIVLDAEMIDAPIIREPIADGAVLLSGGLTLQRAKDLAMLLRAGTLPVPMTIIERQIFEPR